MSRAQARMFALCRHYFGRLLTSTSAQSHEYNSVSQGQYTAISLYSKISRQEGSWQKFSSTSNKDEDEPQSAPSGKKESATVGTEGGILVRIRIPAYDMQVCSAATSMILMKCRANGAVQARLQHQVMSRSKQTNLRRKLCQTKMPKRIQRLLLGQASLLNWRRTSVLQLVVRPFLASVCWPIATCRS